MTPQSIRSVTVQLIILFVALFALFEIASLGYRYLDRTRALIALEAVRIADRIVVLKSLAENAPPENRSALGEHSTGSGLLVVWSNAGWPSAKLGRNEESKLLQDLLRELIPGVGADDLLVGVAPTKDVAPGESTHITSLWQTGSRFPEPVNDIVDEMAEGPAFYVSVRLDDGSWLNFIAAYVQTLEFWPVRRIALLLLLVVGSVALSIWAIQRLTSPFRVFAAAATRLGTDVKADPIEEQGPSEVQTAIRAFNEMQARLKRFVEDRTQMLAAVSHDLRTPITRLRLRADCVKDRVQSRKFLEDLREMEDMIEGVLTFAKEDADTEPTISVDLMTMLQSICDELSDRGFDVAFEAGGRCPYQCRRVAMRRCFANLIENAVKYGARARVRLVAGEAEIAVTIEDQGPGIPAKHREDVFRPFYRLETSRGRDSGGSGLGLTVARTVARAHGGDVVLGATSGGGLSATVTLPRSGKTASSLATAAE